MLDMFLFESEQLLEQLEHIILDSEQSGAFEQQAVNEIFRIMHTIKGSAAVMEFEHMSKLAHAIEDLFHYIREDLTKPLDFTALSDIMLRSIDYFKAELAKIKASEEPDGNANELMSDIQQLLDELKGSPRNKRLLQASIQFEEGCQMENIRAYNVVHQLQEIAEVVEYEPSDIADNPDTADIIVKEGFKVRFRTDRTDEEIHQLLSTMAYMQDFVLSEWEDIQTLAIEESTATEAAESIADLTANTSFNAPRTQQTMISVNVNKLDELMDLIGELVISEAMVTQNPDLEGLELDNFIKSARQHRKIINELQDAAMSIRMVPLSMIFQRMNRIVRDMGRKLNKEVKLTIIGEETEVDKNIIEHLSDPLMHLIRNSIDHGLETAEERIANGKPSIGQVTLEAKNSGGDVLIQIKDDGRGLNRAKIYQKARENGLVNRPEEELSDREIFSYIFLPGFSTNESVTEYSGRGVGMDVVSQNINTIGGTISVDSEPNVGTVFTIKIPLTLAIVDGMNVRVGKAIYTLPINSIKESFKIRREDIIGDSEDNEMIMIRGSAYSILRLHRLYNVDTQVTDLTEGIIIIVEHDGRECCLFVDELVGQQQVVVKAMPDYIKKFKQARGLAGCTLLGDGSISLILDVGNLLA